MHRRGGKRIRMDDPVPPEYEAPMTPMTPSNDNTGLNIILPKVIALLERHNNNIKNNLQILIIKYNLSNQ